ncbi:hypothetical protein CANCADRAFT_32409 [Tortispora caseinolytica NRRL Y-17796]|uniref:Uncharacterized protein n=1 Tax=Tortispora caseinolytica NRRL Y-17796 TaxID=767744 RepID=A0A1E4TB63_9ASCO|nr:hypothetical protein CANCADRAFT_32409 [Tortispora caseinolytica NRRL Y-17796]
MCCPISGDIFLVLIALLFPPLPVWIKRGICSADSLINICLCMLGYIPGLIHSWYIISRYPEDVVFFAIETEGGQYQRAQSNDAPQTRQPVAQDPPRSYGAAAGSSSSPAPQNESVNPDGSFPPTYEDAMKDNKIQR